MSPTGFDVAPTVGALEIGILFAVCLFGAVTVQVSDCADSIRLVHAEGGNRWRSTTLVFLQIHMSSKAW
jgi:hypothetical protein